MRKALSMISAAWADRLPPQIWPHDVPPTLCQYYFETSANEEPSPTTTVLRTNAHQTTIPMQSMTPENECPFTLGKISLIVDTLVDTLAYASRILGDGRSIGSISHRY
eukprot:5642039-Karenia_brevis.AAC.1